MDVIYYVASSLDGYIATRDGEVNWLNPYQIAGEDYGYAAFLDSVDGLILGSRTYEQVLDFGVEWPYPGKPTWVMSRRSLETPFEGVQVTSQSPSHLMAELEQRGHRRLWLVGGTAIVDAFRNANLITEYQIAIMPTLLGRGFALFSAAKSAKPLHLIHSISYPNGVVQLHYATQLASKTNPSAIR